MISINNDPKISVSSSTDSASAPVIYNPEIMWQIRIQSFNRAERWMKVSLHWHLHLRHVSSLPMKLYLRCILHRHCDETIYHQYIGLLHRSAMKSMKVMRAMKYLVIPQIWIFRKSVVPICYMSSWLNACTRLVTF